MPYKSERMRDVLIKHSRTKTHDVWRNVLVIRGRKVRRYFDLRACLIGCKYNRGHDTFNFERDAFYQADMCRKVAPN